MARIRFVAAIVVLGGAAAASFAACSSNNPAYMPYSTTGASSGSATGTPAGGGAATGASGTASTGTPSSGKAGSGTPTSGSSAANSCGPSRYYDEEAGTCMCAGNAYMTKDSGETCVCQSDVPTLCDYDAGQMPQCVDTTTDNANCGGCGITCAPTVACNNSKCGTAPSQLVAPAAGCVSTRVVYDSGNIYWEDLGHGTIKSIPAGSDGGAVTTIVTGQTIAAVQTPDGPLAWPSGPLATVLLVHAGTVYWIAASTPVFCPTDGGLCSGGYGDTIMSATAGGMPKTVLKMSMDPPPSPVSATDAGYPLEQPGQNPPISTMALSPDGNTIYFAAGTRFYSIPSIGGTVTYVTYAEGPEHGEATALAADTMYLYYPANVSGNVEINSITTMCDPTAAANETCPVRIAESQGDLVYDTIVIRGDSLYWGNGQSIRVGSVQSGLAGNLAGDDYPNTLEGSNVTGFAVGTQYGYFGETGSDGAGYIEKGASPPFDGGNAPNAILIARGQPQPMSFALDGTNVYWTTTNCDINYIADSPQ
jgi:hypothetical protein